MSGEHEPDPAALDELLRAFGREPEPPRAADDDGTDDDERAADDASPAEPADEPVADDPAGLGALVAAVERDESNPVTLTPVDERHDEQIDELLDPVDVPADAVGEPAEIFIVEQEPLDADTPSDPEPEPPTVIRIDDYSGSVVVEPVAPSPDPLLAAGSVEPAASDGPADGSDGEPGDGVDGEPIVISIDDEGLPDPVYVEGNLERSGNRSIVFIEDDDTGDTVAPDRNARRGIEPRMRERRAAVKRAMGRKRLRWILAIAAVVIVGVAAAAVFGSSLFAIQEDQVTVTGDVYADPAIVSAVVDDLVGTPALLVDTQTAEDRLEAIPWVDEARVRVSFPHSATIEIREREAMTTYMGPDLGFRVLDREGRVLDVRPGQPIAYMEIRGPDPVNLDPGQFAPQGYAAASDLAKTLTGSVRGRVDYIDVTANGSSLSLHLTDGTIVRFGAARDLLDKLIRLETVLAANPDLEPGVIDVSTSEVTL